jgi:integrase
MLASMGRHRSRDFDLPPRVQRKGNAFYYVTSDKPRKWIPLGSDPQRMRREWAALENVSMGTTVAQLCEKFMLDCTSTLTASTINNYKFQIAAVAEKFGDMPLDQITSYHVAQWRDSIKQPRAANTRLKLGRMAFAKACEWGWCATNPFAEVENRKFAERDRYLTDDEFRAIWMRALPWLRVAMDLAYLTGMRRSDVLGLRWSDVSEAGVTIRQIKTGQRQVFHVDRRARRCARSSAQRADCGPVRDRQPQG